LFGNPHSHAPNDMQTLNTVKPILAPLLQRAECGKPDVASYRGVSVMFNRGECGRLDEDTPQLQVSSPRVEREDVARVVPPGCGAR